MLVCVLFFYSIFMKDKCDSTACTSWLMSKFLGIYLLAVGVVSLMNYNGTVEMVMAEGAKAQAMAPFLHDYLIMLVGYTWPVAATLIGLCLLAGYKRCWAVTAIFVYMLTFVLGHMWAGNMLLAGFALLLVTFTSLMKLSCAMCHK